MTVSARTCGTTHSSSAKRNGGAEAVSAVVDDNEVVRQGRGCRMCSGRHSTTARNCKRHQSTNACPCRGHRIIGTAVQLPAKRNLRLASVWGDGRVRFSITSSLASLRFRLAYPPSRVTACLIRLRQHLRVNACAFRPNGMAVRGSLVLGLTIMRLFVRVGVVECAVAVTQRQPARANATGHRTSIPFGRTPFPKFPYLCRKFPLCEKQRSSFFLPL